jgi:hypothetical protein
MVTRSAEECLILLLSRVELPGDTQAEIRRFWEEVRGTLDYRKVMELAALNLVSPLLYRNFLKLEDVPEYFLEELRGRYLYTLRNNTLHAGETVRLLRHLQEGGVEAIPLKGSLASDIVFRDPGLYPTGDIDLLVRPTDMKKTEEILLEAGFAKDTGFSEEDLLQSHYHLIFHNGTYVVEVHWNLVRRYFEVPPAFWWEDRNETEYSGLRISQLSPERYLLYAIFHLFLHGFRPLKFFVLISELIRSYAGALDWEKLLSYAERYKMKRLTLFTLMLLHELLGTEVPDELRRRHIPAYGFLRRSVLSGLFGDVARTHLKMLNYTLLLDSPGEMARVILRRAFPDVGELRLRFGLPENSKRVYLYYLLNPFFLLLRRR